MPLREVILHFCYLHSLSIVLLYFLYLASKFCTAPSTTPGYTRSWSENYTLTLQMIPPARQVVRRAAVTEEEQRRKRMTSNRLSARKARMKKQQYVDDLAALAGQLKQENEAMRASASVALEQCSLLEQENQVLMAHARELCSVLQLRNFQLRLLGDVASVPLDVPDVGHHLMQLYGGLQMPLPPPPPLPLPPQVQMLVQPDAMDAVMISMLEF